jgi:hypothetical protein
MQIAALPLSDLANLARYLVACFCCALAVFGAEELKDRLILLALALLLFHTVIKP